MFTKHGLLQRPSLRQVSTPFTYKHTIVFKELKQVHSGRHIQVHSGKYILCMYTNILSMLNDIGICYMMFSSKRLMREGVPSLCPFLAVLGPIFLVFVLSNFWFAACL